MKYVFIIAIVAVAMIGVMAPSVFAELTDIQTISVDVDGTPYVISYSVTGITVTEIESYTEYYSLVFSVDVIMDTIDASGKLDVIFDRIFFDSIANCADDSFFILIDGEEALFDEIQTNSQSRTLSVTIPSGTEQIEIIGTVFGNSNEIICTPNPKLEPKRSMDSFSINSENMMEIATTEEYRQACMEQYWIIKSYEYDYSVSLNDYNNAIQKYTWQLRCDDTEKVWYIEPDFIGNKKINDSLELPEEIEKIVEVKSEITCGLGTEDVNGICQVIQTKEKSKGGGCLIATATYGSEMATEVQQLRELRDNQLLNTASGTQFMSTFNDIYYSFSPTIADMEREHPMFKEAVKLAITPMISTLSLMETAESESEVLGLGLSVIMLNIGMYLGVPAIVVIGIRKRI